jgi:hypothetical protein
MHKLLNPKLVLGIVCAVLHVETCYAQTTLTKGARDSVFVGKILVQESVKESVKRSGNALSLDRFRDSLDSQLVSAIAGTRVFTVVDRRRFPDLEDEGKLADFLTGEATSLDTRTAKYALLAEVDGFEDLVVTEPFTQVGRVDMQRKITASAIVQIIDLRTREVLPDIPSVQLEETERKKMVTAAEGTPSDQLLVVMAKKMATKLAQKSITLLNPAKILAVTGKQVMINRGVAFGFEKEIEVDFFAVQSIEDEDTGEVFLNEVPVGVGKVIRSDTKKSFALVTEDLGVQAGCVVKLKE